MFTGIVQTKCVVVEVVEANGVRALTVDLGDAAEGLLVGASVANNGACLTARAIDDSHVTFDLVDETMKLTNLGAAVVGDTVNIERSLKFGDELGGHLVSGHISGTGVVDELLLDRGNRTMWVSVDAPVMAYILWKGWIAVDGVSLTVSSVDRDRHRFAVSLIPETLRRTTLGSIQEGALVNIEPDTQTQTIVQTVKSMFRDTDLREQLLAGT